MAGTNIRTLFSNYPSGFPNGITLRNLPILSTQGARTVWVDSVNGSNSNKGTFDRPYATLAGALAQLAGPAQTSPGDIILCKPGHVETVTAADGINLNQKGLTVLGIGNERSSMPTITFTTSTAARVKIGAADIFIGGFVWKCNIASQVTMLNIAGTGTQLVGNIFTEGTQTGLSFIANTSTANTADRVAIVNNRFENPTAGNMNHAIGLNSVQDQWEIGGNVIRGNFSLSGIHNVTGQIATNLKVHENIVVNLTAGKQAMNLISAVTGVAWGNSFTPGDATVAPAVYGSLVVGRHNISSVGNEDSGSAFIYKKLAVVSSTITTVGVAITGNSTGALYVEDIVVQTDATGLAGGTNFLITVNNADGLGTLFAETVANLGASKTMNLANASVTKTGGVIESGKAITLKSTVANCTGAGVIDIYIKFRRLTAGAFIV